MKLSVLWVNLASSENRSDIAETFRQSCHVRELDDASAAAEATDQGYSLICFEFDYPDVSSLSLLRKTSLESPNIPILMISRVHSEELAVWALRMRVWEYLVTPVQTREVQAVIDALYTMNAERSQQPVRRFTESPNCTIPTDCRYHNNNSQKSQLVPALNYVIDHLHEKIKEHDVAALCKMSPFKFSRSFKRCYGVTFQEYLITMRMEKASQLLANPNVLVADVAFQVGFKDPSYFTRAFKKIKGVSPSDCRGAEGAVSH